jgi:tetratricopeptide (TPR) repeat protein
MRGLLGRGGMGEVYEVFDRLLEHEVALKYLYEVGSEERYRFKAEFRSLANTIHPNLVRLYELVVTDELCFFTMERVRGVDFVTDTLGWAGSTGSDRFERLRDRARQLALAIAALHRAEALHRDIKPSNVLVTGTGRVVLLDFGLVALLSDAPHLDGIAGTLEYMAPEQLRAEPLTAAADWYGFGVTLYEAIAGATPFRGSPFQMASEKRSGRIRALSDLVAEIPPELETLILGLLNPDPAARPAGPEVLDCLGAGEPEGPVSIEASVPSLRPAVLVGRDQELAALDRALEQVRAGGTRVVYLHGPSGVGKTELARAFLRDCRGAETLVLHGRCHPQESVAFNALDRLVDELSRALGRLTPEELTAVLPPDLEALVRVFPVLESIDALAGQDPLTGEWDIGRVRRRAFDSLRELLTRLASSRELIIWIDDLQWGDRDSGMLLRELLYGANPPRVLAILSYRTEDRDSSACLEVLGKPEQLTKGTAITLEVPSLDRSQSLQVLRALAGRPPSGSEADLERLSAEAGGSPFFLGEIARYLSEPGHPGALLLDFSLHDMLIARTSRLTGPARRMVEIVAVAGGPLEQGVLLHAADVSQAERPTITVLERLSLLRTGATEARTAEIYHHRIREEVLRALPDATRAAHHLSIAGAMVARGDPSPQKLVEHYVGGGDLEGARRYVVSAAAEAWTALAFDRAAELYRQALQLGATDLDECELYTRLGHALANAGRGRDAGRAFDRAARILASSDPTASARLLSLQRQAAEHFLKSGHDEEGMAIMHAMLSKFSVRYPKTRGEAIIRALALRGASLRQSPTRLGARALASREDLERIDALWAVSMGMGLLDHLRAGYFSARCFQESARAGDRLRFMRASAIEATEWAAVPSSFFRRRAESIVARAESLATRVDAPYEHGVLFGAKASLAWFQGDWRATVRYADEGAAILGGSCQGVSFELALLHNWSLAALALRGDVRELIGRVRSVLEEADQRDDRFLARSSSLGQPVLAWLALDRPAYAMERAERAIAWWPGAEHTTPHYFHYLAKAQVLLYERNAIAAFACTVEHWPALESDQLLKVSCVRDELLHLRARTALALVEAGRASGAPATVGSDRPPSPKALLRIASRAAERMERQGLHCGRAWATLVLAGAHALEGQERRALDELDLAVTRCAEADLGLYREAARYCFGARRSGGTDDPACKQALEWFRSESVENPPAMVAMLAPGCLPKGFAASRLKGA